MIDIHSHLLYGVDDGADSQETAIQMLKDAAEQGVRGIILTPHYRHGMFDFDLDAINQAYEVMYAEAEKIGVMLYLGCEYHVDSGMTYRLKNGRCLTMAGSDYVLAEYKYTSNYAAIRGSINELQANGYTPIIAHAERYEVFIRDTGLLDDCRSMGAMIQINADSVIGKEGLRTKSLCKKILKADLADIVASDSHNMKDRRSHMKEAYIYISKKYGDNRAKRLFETNPGKILDVCQETDVEDC